jgi:hypothetical protein
MSAANLKANEPSMEEILASIRRIIADDQGKPPAAAPPPPVEPPAPAVDVLDLATVAATLPPSAFEGIDIDFADEEPLIKSAPVMREPEPPPPPPPPPPLPVAEPEQLLSEEAGAAVSSAFSALNGTILTGQGRTLEDVVKDMMRPMIKVWLDENLPSLVERLVKAEIERVSRGPRG